MEDPDIKRKRIKASVTDICSRLEGGATASSDDIAVLVISLQDSWSEIRKDCEKSLKHSGVLFNGTSVKALFDSIQQHLAVAKQWQAIHGLILGTGAMAGALILWGEDDGEAKCPCLAARDLCLSFMDSSNVPVREAVRHTIELLQCSSNPEHVVDILRRLNPEPLCETEGDISPSTPKKLTPFYIDGLLCCLEDSLKASEIALLQDESVSGNFLLSLLNTVEHYLKHESSTVRQVACRVYYIVMQRLMLCFPEKKTEAKTDTAANDAVTHMTRWLCGVIQVAASQSSACSSSTTCWYELECCLLISERLLHELLFDFSFASTAKPTSYHVVGFDVMEEIGVHLRAGYYQFMLHPQFEIRRMASQILPLFARYCCVNVDFMPSQNSSLHTNNSWPSEDNLFDGILNSSIVLNTDHDSIVQCRYLVACRWLIEKCKLIQMITEALAASSLSSVYGEDSSYNIDQISSSSSSSSSNGMGGGFAGGRLSFTASNFDDIDLTMATAESAEEEKDSSHAAVSVVLTAIRCPFPWTNGLQGRLQEEESNIQLRQLLSYMANSSVEGYSQLVNLWRTNLTKILQEIQYFVDEIVPYFNSRYIISMDVMKAAMISNALLENTVANDSALCIESAYSTSLSSSLCDAELTSKINAAVINAIDMLNQFQHHQCIDDEAASSLISMSAYPKMTILASVQTATEEWSGTTGVTESDSESGSQLSVAAKFEIMLNSLVIKKASSGDVAHRSLCSSVCTTLPCFTTLLLQEMTLLQASQLLLVQATWIYFVMTNSLWLDRKLIARKCLMDYFIDSLEMLNIVWTDRLRLEFEQKRMTADDVSIQENTMGAELLVELLMKMNATLDALFVIYNKKTAASRLPNASTTGSIDTVLKDNIDNLERVFRGCYGLLNFFSMLREDHDTRENDSSSNGSGIGHDPYDLLVSLPGDAFRTAVDTTKSKICLFEFHTQPATMVKTNDNVNTDDTNDNSNSDCKNPTSLFSFAGVVSGAVGVGAAAGAGAATQEEDEDEFSDWDDDEYDDASSPTKTLTGANAAAGGSFYGSFSSPCQSPLSSPCKEKFPPCSGPSKAEILLELQKSVVASADRLFRYR